jgi:hypothetical protein
MAYERNMDTTDELLQGIFDAARPISNAAVLCDVTLSVVKEVKMCIQADGGHFELY